MPPKLPTESVEHVQRAQRYLDNGFATQADAELDQIDPRFRLHPDVLEGRSLAWRGARLFSDTQRQAHQVKVSARASKTEDFENRRSEVTTSRNSAQRPSAHVGLLALPRSGG